MEYWRSGTVAGLVRRAGVCVCGTIGANGKNAESGAAEEFTISGAGGQNHRTTTQRVAADQRHAKDDRDAAASSFECYPTMFPRVYPNGDVFYPCEPLHKVAGNLLRDGSLKKIFARGKKVYGDIPPCQGVCYLFGNVLSHYYVNDFWGLAGDFVR